MPAGARAVVVGNRPRHGSAELARSLGATVVECAQRGYGAACHAGLEAATADLVAFCDCDGSVDPGVLIELAQPIVDGRADLIVGRRRPTARGSWPLHARMANVALAWR